MRTLLVLVLLFGLLLLLLSLPSVQTYIAKKATNNINEKYGTDISIEKVGLNWNGDVLVKGVFIKDHKKDTMIYARELATSVLNVSDVMNSNMDLGDVSVDGVEFHLVHYKDDPTDNISMFAGRFSTGKKSTKDFILSSDKITLTNGHLSYVNENLNTPDIIDYENINTVWEDFNLKNVDIDAHIRELNFDAKRGYEVRSLDGIFHYDPHLISLSDMSLSTDHSFMEGSIEMDTPAGSFSDFTNLVPFKAVFAKAKISTNDILPFYDKIAPDVILDVTGDVTGPLNNFRVPNLVVKGLNNSKIVGNVNFKGLIDLKHIEIRGNYRNLETNYFDLKKLLPELLSSLPPEISKLGQISYTGANVVTENAIVIDGSFSTVLGNVVADMSLTGLQNATDAGYKGNIQVNDFNVGKLANIPNVGRTSFNLDVDGRGFIEEHLDTQLSGVVSSFMYNGYNYKDVTIFGNLNTPVFDGEIIIEDPNARAQLIGLIDVSKEINSYDLETHIDYVDLSALHFVNDSISILKGNVVVDMKGTGIEDAFGRISFEDASYENKNGTNFFKDFDITSNFDSKNVRTIAINSSDIINGEVSGIFKFSEVLPLFKNAIGSLYTNYQPEILTEHQFMDFNFTINSKIVEVFVPEVALEPETILRGSVIADDSQFKLTFKSPQINAFGYLAQAVEVRVDNKNPLFNTYIAADSVGAGFYGVSDFNLINVTLKDTLFMRSEFKGGTCNDDTFDLSLYHTINEEGKSVLGFKKSEVVFKSNPWLINAENDKNNNVIFDNNLRDVDIRSIVLSHKDERIDFKGNLRDSTYKDVRAIFNNVDLAKVTPEIKNLALGGQINGELDLLQKDGVYFPESSLIIDSLALNNTLLGDLDFKARGNASIAQYEIETHLERDGIESLTAEGTVDASGTEPTINMVVDIKDFDLSPFNDLGQGIIDNLRGYVSGEALVMGSYINPDINGRLAIENAGMKIPYLNVDYDFTGISNVNLNKKDFIFEDVQLEDIKHKTQGILGGKISHKSFSDWNLDLAITTPRLLVLDTKEELESLYYGTAYLEGEAFIKGPTDNLVIDVFGETAEGTVFKIPISDAESLGDSSYIKFLSPEEKEAKINGEVAEVETISGLSVNFDLDIDPDAEVEVVVDKATGSRLRGRGVGTLLIQLDTNGKFIMNGDFIATQGVFNFRYGGFVTKDFILQQDGNIRWDGDPAKALLDVAAVYRTQANPSVILETSTANRKIPVNVVINVTGQLLKPDIQFDIEFPGAGSTVTSELEFLLQDRNAKELNAISLVSQGTFLSPDNINTASAAVNNLLETTSSILSNILFNDDDSIFDVGVDLVQAERDPTADIQSAGRVGFTLSTQITNRVLINGKVGVPTGGVSESLIVGDVEVDFLLNEDGTLRAKVFNRQTDIQFIGETEGYTQGVGLSYAVDFNTFKELLRKVFRGKSKEAIEQAKGEKDIPNIAPEGVKFNE